MRFKLLQPRESDPAPSNGMKLPSWKHRRRLIYMSYGLGAGMVIFGAFVYSTDTQVASQMIIGGVSLISIILTAYTAFATMDDRFHYRGDSSPSEALEFEDDPDGAGSK